MAHAPDGALRRLVSELASAAPEDIEAILADLTSEQRSRIEELLRELGVAAAPIRLEGARGPERLMGLSPWLTVRLERVSASDAALDDPMRYSMTTGAATLLESMVKAVREKGLGQATRVVERPSSRSARMAGDAPG